MQNPFDIRKKLYPIRPPGFSNLFNSTFAGAIETFDGLKIDYNVPINQKVLFSTGWNFMENSNKFMLQQAHSQDAVFVAQVPNKFEHQQQMIFKPSLGVELRQVQQFVDTGMMTMGQPTGIKPEGAMANSELEWGGHDWTVEVKRLKSQFQSAYSMSQTQALRNIFGVKHSSGTVGIEVVSNQEIRQPAKLLRNYLVDLQFDGKTHNIRINHNNQNFIQNLVQRRRLSNQLTMFGKLEQMNRTSQPQGKIATSSGIGLNQNDASQTKNLKIRFQPANQMDVSMNFVLVPQILSVNVFTNYNFDVQAAAAKQMPHHRLGLGVKFGLF